MDFLWFGLLAFFAKAKETKGLLGGVDFFGWNGKGLAKIF